MENLVNAMLDMDFVILNDGSHTYFSKHTPSNSQLPYSSAINLTMVSVNLYSSVTCEVLPDNMESEHPIKYIIPIKFRKILSSSSHRLNHGKI